jgi:hypothetical protein
MMNAQKKQQPQFDGTTASAAATQNRRKIAFTREGYRLEDQAKVVQEIPLQEDRKIRAG